MTYFFDCEWAPISPLPSVSAPPSTTYFESVAERECRLGGVNGSGWIIGYTPTGGPADSIMARAKALFAADQGLPNVTLVPFATEADLVAAMVPQSFTAGSPYTCLVGVVFSSLDTDARNAEYALRFDSVPGYWCASSPVAC